MIKSLHSILSKSKKPFFRNFSNFDLILSAFKVLEDSNNDIILTTHVNADPDGIGAIFGLYFLFSKYYSQKKIYFSVEKKSKLTTNLLKQLKLDRVLEKNSYSNENLPIDDNFDLITCDTHNYGNIQVLDHDLIINTKNIIFIDHHMETEYSASSMETMNFSSDVTEYKCVENDFKASSEIVLQLFYLLNEKIDLEYLKILILGILTDSRRLMLADSPLLQLIAYWIDQDSKTSLYSLFEMLENDYSRSQRIAKLKAAQRIVIHQVDDYIIALTNISSFEGLVARSLIQLGADISCAVAETKDEIRISLRGRMKILDELNIHLGELAGKIASNFPDATGSGHKGASGINIPGPFSWLEIRKQIETIILEEIKANNK
ncbi:MAG: DHH family phosphoesterase [Candidatus Hodarchaeales archaeon]|jgi:nanoRNase/pAp phosphatase (c-di-AMP/oligoRNAs hydrolase)